MFAAAAWGADATKTYVNGKELDEISDILAETNETGITVKGQDAGMRGSAAVKIYKWSGGAFKTAQTIKDWNWSKSPIFSPDEAT